jgi:hypothetical protein
MGFENPRRVVIPFFTSPFDQVPGGTILNKNGNADPSRQRFDVKRPIVAIKIAADSQVDVCDLYIDGQFEDVGDGSTYIGQEAVSRDRIRVSFEAPFIGRIAPSDNVGKMFAIPVRQYQGSSTIYEGGTVEYPDETRATQYPVLKLEIFECYCKGDCEGHAPPLPTKPAPLILLDRTEDLPNGTSRSFRMPTGGRDAVSISIGATLAGGGTMAYEIKGVDYSARRVAGGTQDDIEKILASAAAQPTGDYLFAYQGICFDEIRVLLTCGGDGGGDDSLIAFIKIEARKE